MADKKEKPKDPMDKYKSVKTHKKQLDETQKILDTVRFYHRKHFDSASEKYLMGKDGQIDMKRLDDGKILDQFTQHITKGYKTSTLEQLKSSLKEDSPLVDIITETLQGISPEELAKNIKEHKSDYNFQLHNQYMEQVMRGRVEPKLTGAASSHFNDENKKDIIAYLKEVNHAKLDPSKITTENAIKELEKYHTLQKEKKATQKKYQ